MSDLKKELKENLQWLEDEDFDHHATDLYVRAYPGVMKYLIENYEFHSHITRFQDSEGKQWLDIPFAGNWDKSKIVS